MLSHFPVFVGRIEGRRQGAKKTPQARTQLYSGGEKVISSNKRVINCGEVKGDWLVSGEGPLAGVTQALQGPNQGCTCRKWQGWGRAQDPAICRRGAEAQSLTPTQPFPALKKKICFSLCKSTTFT